VDFVSATTETGGAKFVPPEQRIATFDQDGTLWVEHPIYSQMMYCLDRVPELAKEKPELKNVEPFKTVLSGNFEAISKLPHQHEERLEAYFLLRELKGSAAQAREEVISASAPILCL
jgi:hypothetical protein